MSTFVIAIHEKPKTKNIKKIRTIINHVTGATKNLKTLTNTNVIATDIKIQISIIDLDFYNVSIVYVVLDTLSFLPLASIIAARLGRH